jgi:hypothetical protein
MSQSSIESVVYELPIEGVRWFLRDTT